MQAESELGDASLRRQHKDSQGRGREDWSVAILIAPAHHMCRVALQGIGPNVQTESLPSGAVELRNIFVYNFLGVCWSGSSGVERTIAASLS